MVRTSTMTDPNNASGSQLARATDHMNGLTAALAALSEEESQLKKRKRMVGIYAEATGNLIKDDGGM